VRVANCSGYHGTILVRPSRSVEGYTNFHAGDPAYEMYRQAALGDVDFITGDYLAGM
jgi:predicted acylesterase/phospholipase RssA